MTSLCFHDKSVFNANYLIFNSFLVNHLFPLDHSKALNISTLLCMDPLHFAMLTQTRSFVVNVVTQWPRNNYVAETRGVGSIPKCTCNQAWNLFRINWNARPQRCLERKPVWAEIPWEHPGRSRETRDHQATLFSPPENREPRGSHAISRVQTQKHLGAIRKCCNQGAWEIGRQLAMKETDADQGAPSSRPIWSKAEQGVFVLSLSSFPNSDPRNVLFSSSMDNRHSDPEASFS